MLMRYVQYFYAFLNLIEFKINLNYFKRKKNLESYTKILDKAKFEAAFLCSLDMYL